MDNKYKEWDKIMFNAETGSIWRKDVEDNIDVDVEKVIQKVYHTKELQTILDDIIKDFIEQMCKIGQVTYISFKRMLPKRFINPHIDSKCNPFKIYIPLTWPKGNYFKIYKKGLIPFEPYKPFLVNTGNNIHSVINDSNEDRYIFSFYADWGSDKWQQIIENSYGKLNELLG